MIIGIGIDLVEVARIQHSLDTTGDRFARRILREDEYAVFQGRGGAANPRGVMFLATRFAAKEAFSKAWGTGIGGSVGFHDLSVLNDAAGKPVVHCHGDLYAASRGVSIWVSLSDVQAHAIAQVILERPHPAADRDAESGTLSP